MKEIKPTAKYTAVKAFLTGLSYDEIAHQIGIAKGSVVNIINDFREGRLQVPRDMSEYVDALRKVAVDMRKGNTGIAQVQSCLKLDRKLREMRVSGDEAEHWLDICHDIVSPAVSTDQFVHACLELSQVTSETGLSYAEVLNEYHTKLARSRELDREIERQEQRITEARSSQQEEGQQASRELEAITKAMATAQEVFRKQKQDLRAQMDEYLAEHKLSWKKIKTAVALFDTELSQAGMAKTDIEQLTKRICDAGSLLRVIKQLKRDKQGLTTGVARLAQEKEDIYASVNALKSTDESLRMSIVRNRVALDALNTDLESGKLQLEDLQQTASQYTENLYVSRLIIDFLFAPKSITDYDLDRLVSMMIGLRQKRLGIGPKRVTDRNGAVVCECQVPRMYGTVTMGESDIDKARENFAYLLAPLVKDKFVSKFDYQMREMQHKIEIADAILHERRQHLI